MRGWGSGPGMGHEPELEEKKTYYSKDDSSFDPDIALSYIGDKVQSILGHFQKDFEGEVSAENLGAKFGGYGSFLPMYQRSPSNMVQPKSPPKVQNMHVHGTTNHLLSEAPAANPVSLCAHSPNAHPQKLKTSIEDVNLRDKAQSLSDKLGDASPRKIKLSKIFPDKKKLKFRIKVGPDRIEKCKAEMYNLGLTSPSSSEENSYEGIGGLQHEYHGSPSDSPANILQTMTSTAVADGLLLSPLCEDLLYLIKEKDILVKIASETSPRSSDLAFWIPSNKPIKMKSKSSEKSKFFEESDVKNMVDSSDCQQKNVKTDAANFNTGNNLNCKPLSDTINAHDMGSKVRKSKGSKNVAKQRATPGDSVKGVYLEHDSLQIGDAYEQRKSRHVSVDKIGENDHKAAISQKDISADHRPLNSNGSNRDSASFEAYPNFSKKERSEDNPRFGIAVLEHGDPGLSQGADQWPIEGNKKSRNSQLSKKTAPKSADGSKDNAYAAPKTENSRNKEIHLREEFVARRSLGHDKVKDFPESSPSDKPKKSNLNGSVKKKPPSIEKTNETASNKKNMDKLSYEIPKVEAPALAMLSNVGISTGFAQPVAAPVVIEENWVGCDRCQKWRLLPYGTKSDQLPDKWVCSMLDWLPGMNSCDISEDETTKALEALYQVPVPGYQHNALAHNDRTTSGVVPAHHLDQGAQNRVLDQNAGQVKKLKLKEKLNNPSLICHMLDGKKLMQHKALKEGYLDKVNTSFPRINTMNEPDMHYQNRLSTGGAKLKKRKGEYLTQDEESRRKKIKKVSSQHVDGEEAYIKSKSSLAAVKIDTNRRLKSGLPGGSAVKNGDKSSVQKTALSRGIPMEKMKDENQKLPKTRPLGRKTETADVRDSTVKKLKIKDYGDSKPHDEKCQDNESGLKYKVSKKGVSEGSGRMRVTNSQASLIGEEDIRKSQGDGMPKSNCVEDRVRFLKIKDPPSNRSENEQERKPRARMQITKEDIDKIKKDLGYEEVPVAATSSSSKVSGSRKKRSHMEMTGSPAESVSSSPVKPSYPNQISPVRGETAIGRLDILSETSNVKKLGNRDEYPVFRTAGKGEATYVNRPDSSGYNLLDFRESDAKQNSYDELYSHNVEELNEKRPGTKLKELSCKKNPSLQSMDSNARHSSDFKEDTHGDAKEDSEKKMRVDLHRGDKKSSLDSGKHALGSLKSSKKCNDESRPIETSVSDTSKVHEGKNIIAPVNVPREDSFSALKEAEIVLKEAGELKTHAEFIKGSGFICESNHEFLKAAVKYLQGASLLEAESCKSLEVNPMQMYGAAAKLCKACAHEYEKLNEMAAASLAYKCMEVAHFRMVYCKSSNTSRLWHDLQSSLQMNPQGESPSSSASDVDNLNNLATADKTTLSKGIVSRPGNNVTAPRNHPNFVRFLDFTRDVNSAMEAAKKSQETFFAAQREAEESQNKEAINSIKEVINFSFQDVAELIRLLWLALNAINHQVLRSHRE